MIYKLVLMYLSSARRDAGTFPPAASLPENGAILVRSWNPNDRKATLAKPALRRRHGRAAARVRGHLALARRVGVSRHDDSARRHQRPMARRKGSGAARRTH